MSTYQLDRSHNMAQHKKIIIAATLIVRNADVHIITAQTRMHM